MKLSIFPLIAAITLSFGLCHSALAAGEFERAVAYYNAGNMKEAASHFIAIVVKNPRDLRAHYYLGNTYATLGQRDKAIAEYMYCAQAAPGTKMETLCLKAVGLQNAKLNSLPNLKDPFKNLQKDAEKKVDIQAAEYQRNQEQQRVNELKNIKSKYRAQQATINSYLRMDMANVPRHIYIGQRSISNPNYSYEIDSLKSEAARKIEDLKHREEIDQQQLNERYDKRIADYMDSHKGLRDALGSTKGNMQLTPHGTSMNVRNYMNFGQETVWEPPVSLQARPLTLQEKAPQMSRAERIRLMRKPINLENSSTGN